jgi:hypothetical protein
MCPFWLEFEPATLVELTTFIVIGIAAFLTSGILSGSRV